ncbi:serine/threonine-protein kinase/receptor [Acrasis kona]|uniref:Serine/threonine-protein kinase/receptor n=1 Tax=Acrasis kona TaxID=1008807 RepID=A0AAW2Z2G6_9EUKA
MDEEVSIPLWAIILSSSLSAVVIVGCFAIVLILGIKLGLLSSRQNEETTRMLQDDEGSSQYYQMKNDTQPTPIILNKRIKSVRYDGLEFYDDNLSPELNRAIINMSPTLKSVEIIAEELTLEEQIGAGSSSVVFKATYMGVPVAVKRCLICDLLEDPLQDFLKETNIMSKLRHQNVVSFLGASIKESHFYIISEYCDNGSLEKFVKPNNNFLDPHKNYVQLTTPTKYKMLLDIALGLLYLEKQNILHRDIKLANLLVDRHYTVKLADFGVSRVYEKGKRMTRVGTVETQAPEVLRNEEYSFKSDVYSFGIVAWELLFEQDLYPGINIYEITKRVVEQGMRPPIPDNHSIDKDLVTLIEQCWSDNCDSRPDFKQIVTLLKKVVERQPEVTLFVSQPKSRKSRDDLVISSQVKIKDQSTNMGAGLIM